MEVISLTKDKVRQINYDGKHSYEKKTTTKEVQNLKIATQFLNQTNTIVINNKSYKIKVPEIYCWNDKSNNLIMEECIGDNLELMLRNPQKRIFGVNLLHHIMKFILDENFYWHDFAPRNILFNNSNSEISLVDFERGISLDSTINKLSFFRENVYEEYVAFLLPEERPISSNEIFTLHNESNPTLEINSLTSNRIKLLARRLGFSNTISYSQYLNIIQMLITAETPFKKGNNIIFPIIELEDTLSQFGYEKYISIILDRNLIFGKEGERNE